jgi:hypothetical protein
MEKLGTEVIDDKPRLVERSFFQIQWETGEGNDIHASDSSRQKKIGKEQLGVNKQ